MNQFFYSELKVKCREIALDLTSNGKSEDVIKAYVRIIDLSDVARNEGLLALEETVIKFEIGSDTDKYLKQLIMLVVDGTEPKLVEEAGINMLISSYMKSYDGLIALMYLYGALMIQSGYNPRVIEELVKSIIPGKIRNEIEHRIAQREAYKASDMHEKLIKKYADETDAIGHRDFSIIGQLSSILIKLSDYSIQRLLREIDRSDLAIAMKAMKGQARKRIFDNISERLAITIAEDMEFMGPIRLKDAEDSAGTILKEYSRCVDTCEIIGVEQITEQSIFEVATKFYEICKMADEQLIREEMYYEGESGLDRTYLYIGNRKWNLSEMEGKTKEEFFNNPEIIKEDIIENMGFGEEKPIAMIESVAWAAIYNYEEFDEGYISIPGLPAYVYSEELCDKMLRMLLAVLSEHNMYYSSSLGEEYMPLHIVE